MSRRSVQCRIQVAVVAVGTILMTALPAVSRAQQPVTFTKDVAPIIQAKCQTCHQPGSIAPMSLMTFQDARPWARSIRERVMTRQMPPWHIDPSVGVQKFENDMSLTDAQIDTIVRWVDGGARQGDPKDMPPPVPPVASNEWEAVRDGHGPPDLVIKSAEYTIKARHQDVWWRSLSDIPLTEPRWVKMVEIKPSSLKARKVVHHTLAYQVLNASEDNGTTSGNDTVDNLVERRPLLTEWAIGKGYDVYRPDTGQLVRPGEKISWDLHIHATQDEDITAGTEVGLWFYPKGQEPTKRVHLKWYTGIDPAKMLDIRPNSHAQTEGFTVLKEHTLIKSFQPHFHLRGKAMEVEAILPTGRRQVISYVGNFNFNWMTNYIYADDVAPVFPKGTIIHVTAWYDNTKANKSNPDPDQWVGYGRRTVDEMAHAWMNAVDLSDEDYKKILQERQGKSATQQQQQ